MPEGRLDCNVVVRSLRLIFWGALLCVLSFKLNGLDIFDDTVGWLLICLGVFPLAKQSGGIHHKNFMLFVQIAAVVSLVKQIMFGYFPTPESLSLILQILGFLTLAGIVVFCMAMRDMAEAHSLDLSKTSWKTTLVLFVAIYAIPFGLFYLFATGAIISGTSFNFNIDNPLLVILILPIFFVPIIHLFISTSRMKKEMTSVAVS
ncbi:MAG: hypothetical protein FJZ10_04510 [Candidatus Omnitrophica bacterium]|nr:hypothetical protein [Candidatus Omnitrophota bacterium]